LVRDCTLEQLEKETEMILDNFGGQKIVPITKLPSRSTPNNAIEPVWDQINRRPTGPGDVK